MNILKSLLSAAALVLACAGMTAANAETPHDNVVGAAGYDLTSYFTQEKPQRGNGHHVAVVAGVTYLFASDDNKKMFEAAPSKFLPQYGGYCAFGASIGKKFVADPDVYDIVDGKLYLNLDSKIRGLWSADIPGRIKTADANWKTIAGKQPADL
ncbi:YHS domain-containing (seleno)protein [Duganella violaceipulchra]|uniref:YHS domain protein n=1 Tax=Duganella violaceipulchra TaxID=2849652 RepID=A0AA41HCY1_9BURK|nr:YHS domain-containing (seleno)protein [Duganella violaceicalia]MBV6323780.1 YHS domain protein [Duganella violaceicalia]MCP2007470.1 YHS domain-containing protein [Duganella violaceicalia]